MRPSALQGCEATVTRVEELGASGIRPNQRTSEPTGLKPHLLLRARCLLLVPRTGLHRESTAPKTLKGYSLSQSALD